MFPRGKTPGRRVGGAERDHSVCCTLRCDMTAFRRHGDPRVITLDGFEPTHAALCRMGMNNEFNYRSRRRRPDPRWTVWHKTPVSRTTRLNGFPYFAKTTPACCPRSVRRPSATRLTLIRISFQNSDPAVAVFP